MFTLCLFMFASVTAVDPADIICAKSSQSQVRDATMACKAADKDPLTTCEMQRMGALKFIIRLRKLEGT